MNEALDVTVYDEDPNKKFQFLGRVLIPLLKIKNGVKKWYALKDKNCLRRSKGQILLELSLVYNPIRAGIRTVNPKEGKLLTTDPKFKRSVFINNVTRVKAIVMEFVDAVKFLNSCFQWESPKRSITAFIIFLLVTYFFEIYMAPAAIVLLFALSYSKVVWTQKYGLTRGQSSEDEGGVDSLDWDEETEENAINDENEKKSLREKLQQVQDITALLQNVLGDIASMGDRVKK